MPQIIVTADVGAAFGEGPVTLRERVNVADFESQHFATQLVERLGWAVADADRAVADADRAEQFDDEGFDDDADRRRAAPDRRGAVHDRRSDRSEVSERLPDEVVIADERVTAPSPA